MRVAVAIVAVLLASPGAYAAEPTPLARARMLYNAADYDGAIAAATVARTQPAAADGGADPADLAAAREALTVIRAAMLSPRDQVDFLVGLGQSLYLTDLFGPAADLFDTALERGALLPDHDRLMLLDWWATALDREAQTATLERRARLHARIAERMDAELRRDPGSAPANYWRAVAARGAGDLDTAWDAAVAAWIRATLGPEASQLRADIDRLVSEAIIPERARSRAGREQADPAESLRSQWNVIKEQWK